MTQFNIPENAQRWLKVGYQGISSMAIFSKITGLNISGNWGLNHPCDPSDFSRCSALLKMVPEFKEQMYKMKEVSEVWANLVDNWDKLEEMLENSKELPHASMYNYMKELGC
jgi:uncharacterized protein YdcH (DUF465 family)